MVDWNPNYPNVFGLEWLTTYGQTTRVWSGAPVRVQRLASTATETIESIKLSGQFDTLSRADTYTVVDVFEAGDEVTEPFQPVDLLPDDDDEINGWTDQNGGTTNIFEGIDDGRPLSWPRAQSAWIQTTQNEQNYLCSVDASAFDSAGDLENARIGFVEVVGVFGTSNGYRNIRSEIRINGTGYPPAGGNYRTIHDAGVPTTLWWGELNPATLLPWTPADIADFGQGGNSRLLVRSQAAGATKYPIVYTLALRVWCVPTENRVAVGVWQRPDVMPSRLANVETDSLVEMPSGSAGWSKESGKEYTFLWRQSISPALYGPVNGDDVRWVGAYQDLGPGGQPPGIVHPLTTQSSGEPASGLASTTVTVDQFGRPSANEGALTLARRAAYAIALIDDNGDPSVDSQPYRLDLSDLHLLKVGTTAGQRLTPSSSQDFLGVRIPVIPPSIGSSTLTFTVHNASTGTQIGTSTFSINAVQARALPSTPEGVRYVTGLFNSAVSLTSGTSYELRVTTNSTNGWILFAPDSSLADEASFGGTDDGFYTGSSLNVSRTLAATLIKQPDAPQDITPVVATEQVSMPDGSDRGVDYVNVTWSQASSTLDSAFSHYELERQFVGDSTWTRVANISDEDIVEFPDRLVPRRVAATYRIRSVASDGRFSAWNEATTSATPDEGDYSILLTSNHVPGLQVILDQDPETRFEFPGDANTEILELHGADYQVVFEETEDRGVVWTASVEINTNAGEPGAGEGSEEAFRALRTLLRSTETPHIAVMDVWGVRKLGHVKISEATQSHPGNVYKATIEVIPTHDEEIPVEVS